MYYLLLWRTSAYFVLVFSRRGHVCGLCYLTNSPDKFTFYVIHLLISIQLPQICHHLKYVLVELVNFGKTCPKIVVWAMYSRLVQPQFV